MNSRLNRAFLTAAFALMAGCVRAEESEAVAVSLTDAATAAKRSLRADPTSGLGRGPISVSISYSLNIPLTDDGPADDALDRTYRQAMYRKAGAECADLLATIAATCELSNINVSTQENRYAGQPPTFYVSVSVTMQITPKR